MCEKIDYEELTQSLISLVRDVPHGIANLANAASLLWYTLPDINWAGFYILRGDKLILGPFQGKPACIEIPVGRGVCGRAAQTRETQRVDDVHLFPGHIACDSASRSELVVPLYRAGELFGLLDIDSPLLARFTPEDRAGLERFAAALSEQLPLWTL